MTTQALIPRNLSAYLTGEKVEEEGPHPLANYPLVPREEKGPGDEGLNSIYQA